MLPLATYLPTVSPLVMGCMRINPAQMDAQQTLTLINTALEMGITLFDHADIYQQGQAEQLFARALALQPQLRQRLLIQSKCGIRFADAQGPKRYDLSASWVQHSVHGSLQRLGIECLDIFLLHRPDPLTCWASLADCLNELVKAGKIQHVGVSNMHWQQIALLQQHLSVPVVVNQIQMSLLHRPWLEQAIDGDVATGTVEYCQRQGIQLQAWGPLDQGCLLRKEVEPRWSPLASRIRQLASDYNVAEEAILLAWLLRLPAAIQPVIGTSVPARIQRCAQALSCTLNATDWYSLLEVARGQEVP